MWKRNHMGNDPILHCRKGADNTYYIIQQRSKEWKQAWKREKVIVCTSRQLKVLIKDCMANMVLYDCCKGTVVSRSRSGESDNYDRSKGKSTWGGGVVAFSLEIKVDKTLNLAKETVDVVDRVVISKIVVSVDSCLSDIAKPREVKCSRTNLSQGGDTVTTVVRAGWSNRSVDLNICSISLVYEIL
ncbi:hypothetical protein Tco_0507878 [Tanacetum coccineum]